MLQRRKTGLIRRDAATQSGEQISWNWTKLISGAVDAETSTTPLINNFWLRQQAREVPIWEIWYNLWFLLLKKLKLQAPFFLVVHKKLQKGKHYWAIKGVFMCIHKKWLEANSHKCDRLIPQHWTITGTLEAPISLEDVTEEASIALPG